MKKTGLLFLFCLFILIDSHASHIVGGEIEITNYRGYTYTLTVKMYVDELDANPGVIAKETSATIAIFSKSTNQKMYQADLPRKSHIIISYQQACDNQSSKAVQTGLLTFSGTVFLDPSIYNDPNGYYIVFEDCCRNGIIKNILTPDSVGMAFYTEFPPVTKNGGKFINSSPQFATITGDYPCLNRPFTFDFSGKDINGDSLVYEVSTPFAGHANLTDIFTSPQPAPYPEVQWSSGYGITHEINGTPPFSVNTQTGQIYFTPNETGVFVFSVNVYEYRNGVKIGMVKRDFQLPVVQCPNNAPNAISLTLPSGSNYNSSTDTIKLHIDQDTCFTIKVSDQNPVLYNQNENLAIKILNNELPNGILNITPSSVTVTTAPGKDTTTSSLCINACDKLYLSKDSIFHFKLMVTDAPKCPPSLAYSDTMNVVLEYLPQLNNKPIVNIVQGPGPFTVTRGKNITLDVYAKDPDKNDIVTLTGNGVGFSFDEKGMTFNSITGVDSVSSPFKWTPQCEDLDPGSYKLRFIAHDNSCISLNKDTMNVILNVVDTTTVLNEIHPTNLFTPNNDSLNDYFELHNIPEGNCIYYFKSITIYNRWGAKIFESTNPHFKWSGEGSPSGIYFYIIDINKKTFKNWVEIIR